VTRIISGIAGGLRLVAPHGSATRPTSDRVREALFSAIVSEFGSLEGLRFLDLYAGSGAVGLEAWSRGAGVVKLVEQDRKTAGLIAKNAAGIGFPEARVSAVSVSTFLSGLPSAPYDIVFLDPPYALPDEDVAHDLERLASGGWLSAGAMVIVERSSRTPEPTWPDGIEPGKDKKYGETRIWYGHATDQ
jgi:16S rRNA (guanine966-N2)-methyltransferase